METSRQVTITGRDAADARQGIILVRVITHTGVLRRPAARVVAALLGVALLVTGCTQTDGPDQPPPMRTLVVGATAQPPTMDAAANDAAAISQVLLYNVYETLVKLDNEGNIQPLLANRYDVSGDRLTYTFNLDPQAKFASGRELVAEDVVFSIERLKEKETIKKLKDQMAVVKTARAVDEKTVEVVLKRPSNSWLFDMTSTAGMVVDSKSDVDLATDTAGSGPYELKQWNQGSSVVLGKNPNYWATPARFDEVTFSYFDDANAENAAMLAGQLDIISNVQAPQALDQFSDSSRFTVVEGSTNGEVVLSFNNESKGLKDKRVRQAINHAIDRQGLIDTVWAGKGQLIGSMVAPTDPWFEDLSGTYAYDPAKAKALLKEAGFEKGLKLRLRLPTLPYATSAGQYVASQLSEVGIDAQIDELEFPSRWIDEVLIKANYDMSIVAHVESRDIVRFADPEYYFRYDNAKFQSLIKDADQASPEEYEAKMRQAAKILAQDAAADWLFLLPNLVVSKDEVTGIAPNSTSLSFDLTTIAKR